MDNIKDFEMMKNKIENLQREADKATGALEQTMKILKDEFDCDSLKEAKKLLIDLERKEEKSEDEFDKAMENFREKWRGKL